MGYLAAKFWKPSKGVLGHERESNQDTYLSQRTRLTDPRERIVSSLPPYQRSRSCSWRILCSDRNACPRGCYLRYTLDILYVNNLYVSILLNNHLASEYPSSKSWEDGCADSVFRIEGPTGDDEIGDITLRRRNLTHIPSRGVRDGTC